MPTYDYECSNCQHRFDTLQRMSDDPLTVCPECNEEALKRLIGGGAGIIFKGSGFYATDSKPAAGSKSASSTESGSESNDGGTQKSQSETKKSDNGSGRGESGSAPKSSGSEGGTSTQTATRSEG
jgi:putative FmdB family regulatory protein